MDLFEFASHSASSAAHVEPVTWNDPGATVWGRAWLDNVQRLCLPRHASELTFGKSVLQAGRLRSCRVRGTHAQATFANREGGTVLVNLRVKPLSCGQWHAVEQMCGRHGDALFSSEERMEAAADELFAASHGLLPQGKELFSSCSHCRRPFCIYRAATLLALAVEFDRSPIKLFELRGAARAFMLTHAAQLADESEERLPEEDLASLFGVDLVEA